MTVSENTFEVVPPKDAFTLLRPAATAVASPVAESVAAPVFEELQFTWLVIFSVELSL